MDSNDKRDSETAQVQKMESNQVVNFTRGELMKQLAGRFVFEGTEVRVVVIDGKTHMVGKDLCDVLVYADHTNAMKLHCRGVAIYHPIADALGRMRNTRVLSEGDMFRLITHSTLPAAERFERLVFDEILPTIHRHGCYPAPAVGPAPVEAADPLQMIVLQSQTIGRMALQAIETNRQLRETQRGLQDLREEIPMLVSNAQARSPVEEPTSGAVSMNKLTDYWNAKVGLPHDVTEYVLRQLPRFRISPSEVVGKGARIRSNGDVVKRADGSVPQCAGYKAYQTGIATRAMEKFLRECVRHPINTRKATHPDIDRPFQLKPGFARGEKRDARDVADRGADLR
ncbi:Bro-N domain-containing protein [Paraburkholderia sp. EG287A]|uniref:Bro-N domain-containing protein n=1 Tax=Paraburkholderia sp. EG287A TaxID=3237012 RepID=UPI0034D2F962